MIIDLIMLRHGVAEDVSSDHKDSSRRLTEKGKKKLHDNLPALLPLIDSNNHVEVWTSPLIRAKETAEILLPLIKSAELVNCDFVANGDYKDFWAAINKLDDKKKFTIIIVGHEPHLSNWSSELCGLRLPYRKGAAAGIKVNTRDAVDSELKWFLQPREMSRLLVSKK
ncbi:MAG: histidine phosphatase family protein [Clostridiaceae bacterium]